jgi:hypothetical protein
MASMPGAEVDMRDAIALLEEAVAAPDSHSRRIAEALLGSCLIDRAQTDDARPTDLDDGLRRLRALLDGPLPPRAHLMFQQQLADGLLVRSQRDLDPADLDEAAAAYTRIRGSHPEDSPQRAVVTGRLAMALMMRADSSGDQAHVGPANADARVVATSDQVGGVWSLDAAVNWGQWAWRRGMYPEAGEAFGIAVAAMYRLTGVQIDRAYRELMLRRRTADVAARGAYAQWMAGRPQQAVVTLETGRAVALSNALDRELAPLDALAAAGRGDLCERFRAAARAVAEGEHRPPIG